jgi:hypothetical protein
LDGALIGTDTFKIQSPGIHLWQIIAGCCYTFLWASSGVIGGPALECFQLVVQVIDNIGTKTSSSPSMSRTSIDRSRGVAVIVGTLAANHPDLERRMYSGRDVHLSGSSARGFTTVVSSGSWVPHGDVTFCSQRKRAFPDQSGEFLLSGIVVVTFAGRAVSPSVASVLPQQITVGGTRVRSRAVAGPFTNLALEE